MEERSGSAGLRMSGAGLGTGPMLLVLGAALVLVMAGMRDIGHLVGPAFLALTLAVTARPLGHRLRARGIPRWASTVLVLALLYVVLVGMLATLGLAVTQFVGTLPTYAARFTTVSNAVLSWLAEHGVHEDTIRKATTEINVGTVVGVAQGVLSSLTSGATGVLFLLLSLAFLVIDTAGVEKRAALLHRSRPDLAAALDEFTWRVRRYWLVSAVFGAILAVADYVALLLLGVPLPLTWAVVAFICNFVPNIGFALAVLPPAVLGLLVGGPGLAFGVIGAYVLISFVVQTLMLPRFMGNAVGLNTMTTFLSLVFWTGVIGGLGALLAIPLTLFVKAVVIDSTPALHWMRAFVGGEEEARLTLDAGVEVRGAGAEATTTSAEQSRSPGMPGSPSAGRHDGRA